jgi:YVTN family beta-propeller protein
MSFPARIVGLLLVAQTWASAASDLKIIAHFPIGGEVRYDYLTVDPAGRRLFVSHSTRVDVLDVDSGRIVGEIGPLKGIHGIALVPELRRGFISSGTGREVAAFSMDTLAIEKVIADAGAKPDSIRYDPGTRRIYVANGSNGGITVIDPATMGIIGRVPLGGSLEEMAFDGRGRLFVNTEDRSLIQVVDLKTLRQVASWPIAPVEGGTGLAIDAAHHRLFSAGANGRLAVVDSDTGALVATPAIGEDPDGAVFDPAGGLIFTSGVQGTLSVLHEDGPDAYSAVQTVATAPGARTLAQDAGTGRIFMPTGKFHPVPPTPGNPHPRPQGEPGTFEVLVVGR